MISILEFQLKEQYGSLDGPDVLLLLMNFDEVDIPLFLNSLDIFAESMLVLFNLLLLWV